MRRDATAGAARPRVAIGRRWAGDAAPNAPRGCVCVGGGGPVGQRRVGGEEVGAEARTHAPRAPPPLLGGRERRPHVLEGLHAPRGVEPGVVTACCVTVWYGMVWYDMIWYDMI